MKNRIEEELENIGYRETKTCENCGYYNNYFGGECARVLGHEPETGMICNEWTDKSYNHTEIKEGRKGDDYSISLP